MHITGSSDCVHPDDIKKMILFVQHRVEDWSIACYPFCQNFDEAVRSLCLAVLEEASKWEKEQRELEELREVDGIEVVN